MIPDHVAQEAGALRARGFEVEVIEDDGFWNVMLEKYPLPSGYTQVSSSLLIRLPLSYRNGKPDMFWVEKDVLLADGRIPRNADIIEAHLGREWRRFSWHPKSWNPGRDNLDTYVEFVNRRLSQAE